MIEKLPQECQLVILKYLEKDRCSGGSNKYSNYLMVCKNWFYLFGRVYYNGEYVMPLLRVLKRASSKRFGCLYARFVQVIDLRALKKFVEKITSVGYENWNGLVIVKNFEETDVILSNWLVNLLKVHKMLNKLTFGDDNVAGCLNVCKNNVMPLLVRLEELKGIKIRHIELSRTFHCFINDYKAVSSNSKLSIESISTINSRESFTGSVNNQVLQYICKHPVLKSFETAGVWELTEWDENFQILFSHLESFSYKYSSRNLVPITIENSEFHKTAACFVGYYVNFTRKLTKLSLEMDHNLVLFLQNLHPNFMLPYLKIFKFNHVVTFNSVNTEPVITSQNEEFISNAYALKDLLIRFPMLTHLEIHNVHQTEITAVLTVALTQRLLQTGHWMLDNIIVTGITKWEQDESLPSLEALFIHIGLLFPSLKSLYIEATMDTRELAELLYNSNSSAIDAGLFPKLVNCNASFAHSSQWLVALFKHRFPSCILEEMCK